VRVLMGMPIAAGTIVFAMQAGIRSQAKMKTQARPAKAGYGESWA
jgi:hypothetical protein